MNTKQKKILVFGIAVAVLMGAFPPWSDRLFYDSGAQGTIQSQSSAGYSFIADPPRAANPEVQMLHTFTIDVRQLFVQWVIVALAVGGGLVYFREPAKRSEGIL
jgi:hypothetical protein